MLPRNDAICFLISQGPKALNFLLKIYCLDEVMRYRQRHWKASFCQLDFFLFKEKTFPRDEGTFTEPWRGL